MAKGIHHWISKFYRVVNYYQEKMRPCICVADTSKNMESVQEFNGHYHRAGGGRKVGYQEKAWNRSLRAESVDSVGYSRSLLHKGHRKVGNI